MQLVIWFVAGAGMGSVANALIDRLPRRESWMKGRSHCDKCGHTLGTLDLIPLLSYLVLSAKYKGCRYCHKSIGIRNFLVELLMATGFGLIYNFQFSIFNQFSIFSVLILNLIFFITVVVAVMDWEIRLVSEKMIIMWGFLVLTMQFASLLLSKFSIFNFQFSINSLISQFSNNLFGLVMGVGLIGGLWAVSRGKAMGSGDVEIAAVMGWWLGWPKIAPALWIAFVAGALVGSWFMVTRKLKIKSEIAFGPFLVIGAWIGYFWGDKMLTWVFRF